MNRRSFFGSLLGAAMCAAARIYPVPRLLEPPVERLTLLEAARHTEASSELQEIIGLLAQVGENLLKAADGGGRKWFTLTTE